MKRKRRRSDRRAYQRESCDKEGSHVSRYTRRIYRLSRGMMAERKAAGLELPRDREQEQERPREGPFVVCTYASAETQRQTSASRAGKPTGNEGATYGSPSCT